MTSSTTSSARIAFATLLAAAVFGTASAGCSVFGSDPGPQPTDDPAMPSRDDPKATPVGGPADPSELTDSFGIFVAPAPAGQATASGSHDHPLASIQAGIDIAKHAGKRVYVCAGTFHEQITIADSISVIGGLDCTDNEWTVAKTGAHTRIEAPKSPAVHAMNITAPTRLEGLDVAAPDASGLSGSSIGLLADHAGAITIATSKITAGVAVKGEDGSDGIQLRNAATANGTEGWDQRNCTAGGGCTHDGLRPTYWALPPRGKAGENICVGAAGFVGQTGGFGGSGGLYQIDQLGVIERPELYLGSGAYQFEPGDHTRTGAAGTNGPDGAGAATTVSISAQGFTTVDGTAGKDGTPGFGGHGGDGYGSDTTDQRIGDVWAGWTGAGGGAGGCPGLAGSAGKGGGASIAALLIESAVSFDGVDLVSSRSGAGGLGSFGSTPTAGGLAGFNTTSALIPARSAQPGGRGGAAGVSGNGANGPSLGIAYVGAKPVVSATSHIAPGSAPAAIAARSRTTLDVTKTVPATPAGISKDILAL